MCFVKYWHAPKMLLWYTIAFALTMRPENTNGDWPSAIMLWHAIIIDGASGGHFKVNIFVRSLASKPNYFVLVRKHIEAPQRRRYSAPFDSFHLDFLLLEIVHFLKLRGAEFDFIQFNVMHLNSKLRIFSCYLTSTFLNTLIESKMNYLPLV